MPTIEIQDAEVGDARTLAEVWIEANRVRRNGHFEVPADFRVRLEERIHDRDSAVVVAKDAGRVVGIGSYAPARERDGAGPVISGLMHVSMIAVDPARWGSGIGKAIAEYLVRRAMELGYSSIQLWTHVSNERARRLYTSVGFNEAGREKSDERGEQIRLYVLDLSG